MNLTYMKPARIGEEIIIEARTLRAGKTLAFLLPLFRHIADQDELEEGDGPIAIIMTPTRELCLQVSKLVFRVHIDNNNKYCFLVINLSTFSC